MSGNKKGSEISDPLSFLCKMSTPGVAFVLY